jgi:hypothetical protein
MFVRFLCNWPPYKDGQCLEIPDRIGADFVARCMAEIVAPADVREYARTMEAVDRCIDKRIGEMPARAARREITEDELGREIGRDHPRYWESALAHQRARSRTWPPSGRNHS